MANPKNPINKVILFLFMVELKNLLWCPLVIMAKIKQTEAPWGGEGLTVDCIVNPYPPGPLNSLKAQLRKMCPYLIVSTNPLVVGLFFPCPSRPPSLLVTTLHHLYFPPFPTLCFLQQLIRKQKWAL